MSNKSPKKQVVISLSGGMDSSTLLLRLISEGYEITALGFHYGQKHSVELERSVELVDYLAEQGYPIKHQIIELKGLQELLNSNLVKGGKDVPEGHYENENMKATVVPNRNKMFSSIIQAVALSIADTTGEPVKIAMGLHAGDHAIYPDCRQEFRDADYNAFVLGNWGAEQVSYYTPYLLVNKYDILEDGLNICQILGINFDEVYKRTNTSYKPIYIEEYNNGIVSYGKWYSDYKSASSVERIEGFIKLDRPDPVEYADETGPVTWEVAKAHVEAVLASV